jgi:2-C-methyl-D-erythritol 4-phosphate cytidylyltransferase/2-C-methyl-D-erythritol 2,4-cyclodiphosphate synthase
MSYCAIILAAGKGHRYSRTIPKQYTILDNELIINYSLKIFSELKPIKKIILVINKRKFTKFKDKVYKNKKIKIIQGGKERKDSVLLALWKLKKNNYKKVLIHDAARPFLKKILINKIIKFSKKNDAVIPYISNTDTIVFKNKILDRKKVLSIQTPQCFSYRKLFSLHKEFANKKFSDESSLFFLKNFKVKKILGDYNNIKITLKNDINKNDINRKTELSYGIGYDIHKLEKNYKLYLGGTYIPYSMGTVGHSDGDPVIHALIDSLLGSKKLGDIGTLFPNNKKFKKKRSAFFLKKVINLIEAKNIKINNIDINIIAQKPNLKKYKKIISKNLAKICNISEKQISVKGKTTDRLGNVGKNKAIACEVITSVTNS